MCRIGRAASAVVDTAEPLWQLQSTTVVRLAHWAAKLHSQIESHELHNQLSLLAALPDWSTLANASVTTLHLAVEAAQLALCESALDDAPEEQQALLERCTTGW